jgi:hypothetical protein
MTSSPEHVIAALRRLRQAYPANKGTQAQLEKGEKWEQAQWQRMAETLKRYDPPVITRALELAPEQCAQMPRLQLLVTLCNRAAAQMRESAVPLDQPSGSFVPWGDKRSGPWPLPWVLVRLVKDGRASSFDRARAMVEDGIRRTSGGIAEYCAEAERIRMTYGNSIQALDNLTKIGSFELR